MKSNAFIAVLFTTLVLLTSPVFVWSQTGVDQGVYLNGLGWYNYNTARATSINVDSVIKWKADLRKIQYARRDWQQVLANDKKLKADEIKQRIAQREQELRENPSAQDVMTGDALNVLQYDLTDPQISLSQWQAKAVKLPEGLSIKDLVFKFMPAGKTNQSAIALSRGVIALSRLDIKGKWPTSLNLVSLEKEKAAYENAYETVREQILGKDFHIGSVLAMDRSIDALRSKVNTEVPVERGYRTEALKFVDDLKDATRMFDAATVDYAREILIDTKEHEATTVGQLMGFMLKYRLQFANVERDPKARELYTKVYDAMRIQAKELGAKPEVDSLALSESTDKVYEWKSLFNGKDLTGWIQHTDSTGKWSVQNGNIVGRGVDQSHLFTDKGDFTDFHLRAEARINENGNSGICFRTVFFGRGRLAGNGYEANIEGDKSHKWLTGSLMHISPKGEVVSQLIKPNEWFTFEVIAEGNHITIKVDGKITCDLIDTNNTYKKGYIALQQLGDKTEVQFRKIEIKSLSR